MKMSGWSKCAGALLVAFVLAGALAGCATPQRIDWTARMGHYTYDQAIKDFGPPDRSAKLTDGTVVSEWLTRRGPVLVQTEPFYPGPYGPAGPMPPAAAAEIYAPDYYMRLTFAPNGLLEGYKDVMR
jgi:hypothetical protein